MRNEMNRMSRTHAGARPGLAVLAVAGAALVPGLLAGCRGERTDKPPRQFLPDMDDSPKFKAQVKTEFFPDHRSMRPKVPGTVAFGTSEHADDPARAEFLKDDEAYYYGTAGKDEKGAPKYVQLIPVASFPGWPADTADQEVAMGKLIQRGQQRFNIYCSVCHGFKGDATGQVGLRWTTPPANFHDPKYLDRAGEKGADGFIFYTIRNGVIDQNGVQKMPPYAHAITEADAWAIVSYVRVLQTAYTTDMSEVPQAERERLRQNPPPPPPPPEKPAPTPPAPGVTPAKPGTPATSTPPTPPPPPPTTGGAKP